MKKQRKRSVEWEVKKLEVEEFLRGLYKERNPMYAVASFLISHFWGEPRGMAEGIGVLLLTWNQGFYRFGDLDFDKLENCIRKKKNLEMIKKFRSRNILSLSDSDKDEEDIRKLFAEFLEALMIKTKKVHKEKVTPVGVAKALHLLAPEFFPMWDDQIAKDYRCTYNRDNAAGKYISFCYFIKELAEKVENYAGLPSDRTLVKLIDEYNHKTRSKKGKKQYKVQKKVS